MLVIVFIKAVNFKKLRFCHVFSEFKINYRFGLSVPVIKKSVLLFKR